METAEAISDEIEEAMEELSKDAKDSPGFVAPVKQGVPNNSGEEKPKVKATCTRDWVSASKR